MEKGIGALGRSAVSVAAAEIRNVRGLADTPAPPQNPGRAICQTAQVCKMTPEKCKPKRAVRAAGSLSFSPHQNHPETINALPLKYKVGVLWINVCTYND